MYPNIPNHFMECAVMDLKRLQENWNTFIENGVINDDVNPFVANSWQKCRLKGVDPMGGHGTPIDDELFASIIKENQSLIETALPIMQSVFKLVRDSHSWLVLTDGIGYILKAVGDSDMASVVKETAFVPGALWNDLTVGTNAISIALDYDTNIQMVGPEHYCLSHQSSTCAAAPIHGLGGEIVGCMNITSTLDLVHPYAMGLVMTAALGIETQLKSNHNARLMQISLDGNSDSMIVLDSLYRPVWTNLAARSFLDMSKEDIEDIGDFRAMLPDIDWEDVVQWDKPHSYFTNDTRLVVENKTLFCSAAITTTNQPGYSKSYSLTLKRQEQIIQAVNLVSGNRATYTFNNIHTQNANMRKVIALAKRYSRYAGIVLIQGESGTGKELFAQAIHNASDRANKPFVAINCASLPRDLIESELFGYEKGAFTGAHKEGNPGKFELADHGTIFLDEIGELPLEFQAKLLRIVETRMVRRIGGRTEKKLDVRIIAATNRNLREEVDEGRFRDDLFFRLNVLWLAIPPLRERRDDIVYIAEKFLEHFNSRYPEQSKVADEDFMVGLSMHNWPGNVRELHNGIERAFYASSDKALGADDVDSAIGIPRATQSAKTLSRNESQLLEEIVGALEQCGGCVDKAAKRLRLSRASVYRYTKKFGLSPKRFK